MTPRDVPLRELGCSQDQRWLIVPARQPKLPVLDEGNQDPLAILKVAPPQQSAVVSDPVHLSLRTWRIPSTSTQQFPGWKGHLPKKHFGRLRDNGSEGAYTRGNTHINHCTQQQ